MESEKLRRLIRISLPKQLLLDLVDAVRARALGAHTMIRDHADLDARRSRQVEGRVRFPMQEQSFQQICLDYGGDELTMDVLPGTDLKVYQPFMRFAAPGERHGIILGFAAMPDCSTLPTKNLSRGAAASLNYNVELRLDLDGRGPQIGDIYVMFLAAPDRQNAGMVKEVAVAVVDSEYQKFILYEDVNEFISKYSEIKPEETPDTPPSETFGLKLRKQPKRFVPPEDLEADEDDKKKTDPKNK
jgi:hypothetical protein